MNNIYFAVIANNKSQRQQPISCHWSLSMSPEKNQKPEVF